MFLDFYSYNWSSLKQAFIIYTIRRKCYIPGVVSRVRYVLLFYCISETSVNRNYGDSHFKGHSPQLNLFSKTFLTFPSSSVWKQSVLNTVRYRIQSFNKTEFDAPKVIISRGAFKDMVLRVSRWYLNRKQKNNDCFNYLLDSCINRRKHETVVTWYLNFLVKYPSMKYQNLNEYQRSILFLSTGYIIC